MFEHKYLKYRQKYINLKNELLEKNSKNKIVNEMIGGNNNKIINIMEVDELSNTPTSSIHDTKLSLSTLNKILK